MYDKDPNLANFNAVSRNIIEEKSKTPHKIEKSPIKSKILDDEQKNVLALDKESLRMNQALIKYQKEVEERIRMKEQLKQLKAQL